jgi:hypothetical protein
VPTVSKRVVFETWLLLNSRLNPILSDVLPLSRGQSFHYRARRRLMSQDREQAGTVNGVAAIPAAINDPGLPSRKGSGAEGKSLQPGQQ